MKNVISLGTVCMLILCLFSSCGDRHPEYPYLGGLATDNVQLDIVIRERAFVHDGLLYYEGDGNIYDQRGDSVIRLDSRRMYFDGETDPAGRLIYHQLTRQDDAPELWLFNLFSPEAEQTIDIFSLSDLRKKAEESRRSFELPDSIRQALEKAGCFLPVPERAPRWNTEVFTREYTYEPTVQSLRQSLRQINDENEEKERYRKELSAYLDRLQRKYEEAISRFIEANRAKAYTYLYDDYHHPETECIVLPEKGIAFEKTAGIKIKNLPSYASVEPLPQWDRKRNDIALRRTGSASWITCEFKLIVSMVPWLEIEHEQRYYYKLSLGGHKWDFKTEAPVELFECWTVADTTWFSFIDEYKHVSLLRYTN